jgi:hypothetical protein
MWSPGPSNYAERDETSFGERIGAKTIAGLEIGTERRL